MNNLAVILFNRISDHPGDDELDVLEQVEIVEKALKELGMKVKQVQLDLNLKQAVATLKKLDPLVVFNLAETIENHGEFAYMAPALLTHLNIPYTGSPVIPMFFASNKVRAKIEMKRLGIPTPAWFEMDQLRKLDKKKKYIVKPIWEEGSLGLDEDCIFAGDDQAFIAKISKKDKNYFFVEEFVEGREFNISIIAGKKGPEVLPFAEMTFINYPKDKPKIMGYTAKWNEDSFEYSHTCRTFEIKKMDPALISRMQQICKKTWNAFGLKGYVRLDFRIDKQARPYVIDINANPCLSGSGGFMAASEQAGLDIPQIMRRIVEHALGYPLPDFKKTTS
jgi:D-alanine-D-alanine ligase